MYKRNYRRTLWSRFHLLAEDLFETLTHYLTIDPESPLFGKIFKLDLTYYEEQGEEKLKGIKLFPDQDIYVLVEHGPLSYEWMPLLPDLVELPNSVSRIDLLMWYTHEIETHHQQEEYWIEDTGTIYRATIQPPSDEP